MFQRLLALVVLVLLASQTAFAATRDVCPACTYTNISDAVHAAQNGDTIRVAAGSYTGFENIPSFSSGGHSLSLEGGYRADFSARDAETILDGISIQLSPWYVGSVSIDNFTFAHSGNIYVASTAASLAVSNCRFSVASGAAISVSPYYPLPDYPWADRRQRASTAFSFINNDIVADPTAGAIDVSLYSFSPWVATTVIEGNVIRGATQQYASAINYSSNGNDDSVAVSNNHLYGNARGIILQMSGANGFVEIAGNRIHDNSESAMRLSNAPSIDGHFLVHHNLFYSQPQYGVLLYSPGMAKFYNNVFYANQRVGLKIYGATGHPSIVNNIFSEHPQRSIEITGSESGWGSTQIVPTALRYNNFFNTVPAAWFMHESLPPAYSYNNELPGDYNDINQFAWSDGNHGEDPHFLDPSGGDFRLANNSFSIDEGDSNEDFVDEPLPNGARINLGVNGNTAFAEPTPTLAGISNLVAAQVGEDIQIDLDLSQEESAVWLLAEYSTPSGWATISPSALNGAEYRVGYKAGRIHTGSARRLTWTTARAALDGITRNDFRIRLTIMHGERSALVESPAFGINYAVPTVVITMPSADNFIARQGAPFVAEARGFLIVPSSMQFEYKVEGAGSFTTLSSDITAPYRADWGGVALIPGMRYVLRATALDSLGNPYHSSEIVVTACGESLLAGGGSLGREGEEVDIAVTSGASCSWSATTAADWITILSGTPGSGSGSLRYRVSANRGDAREATISIGTTSYLVQQAGIPCSIVATVSTSDYSAAGGRGVLSVDASREDCSWSLEGVPAWITGVEVTSGSGDGLIHFDVSANSNTETRQTTLSVAGQQFTLTQSAVPLLTISILKHGAGNGTVSASGQGFSCGESCVSSSFQVRQGGSVKLEGMVPVGSRFTGWQGGSCSGVGSCEFVAVQDLTVIANFAALPPLLTASVSRLTFTKRKHRLDFILQNRGTVPIRILGVGLSTRGSFTFSGIKAGTTIGVRQNKRSVTVALKSNRIASATATLIITTTDPNRPTIQIPLMR